MSNVSEDKFSHRPQTLCFTGHRSLPSGGMYERLTGALDAVIRQAAARGFKYFITGGAIGFDTLAACRVIAASKSLPDVNLLLSLPCRNQTEKWNNVSDIAIYKKIMGFAADVLFVSDFYTDDCMLKRNRFMVDHSSLCVAYCLKDKGGTAYTIKYAEKCGIKVVNIAENNYSIPF